MTEKMPALPETSWKQPPQQPLLGPNDVHVWRADLNRDDGELERSQAVLSEEERGQAAKFLLPLLSRRYVVCHGILRFILGLYLGIPPGRVAFVRGAYGKPYLAPACAGGLFFNLAHSEGLALFALAREREVGVDLERIRPEKVNDQVAERFFSPRETAWLRSLPEAIRHDAFFRIWVCKEAYLKAAGKGITRGLNQVEVSFPPERGSPELRDLGFPPEASSWTVRLLHPGAGFVGAVAAKGADWSETLLARSVGEGFSVPR